MNKLTNNKDNLERNMIKKGMVILDDITKYKNNVVSSFWARINILHHSTTMTTGYSPVIHCGPIRQAARMETDDKILRSGDNMVVRFTFLHHMEFIEENMIFFFRDGTTKGVGEVIKLNE